MLFADFVECVNDSAKQACVLCAIKGSLSHTFLPSVTYVYADVVTGMPLTRRPWTLRKTVHSAYLASFYQHISKFALCAFCAVVIIRQCFPACVGFADVAKCTPSSVLEADVTRTPLFQPHVSTFTLCVCTYTVVRLCLLE